MDAREKSASTSDSPSPRGVQGGGVEERLRRLEARVLKMEARVLKMEENERKMEEELQSLRDRLEESEWGRDRMEERLKDCKELAEEVEALREEVKKERKERKEKEEKIEALVKVGEEKRLAGDGGSGGGGGGVDGGQRYRCIIFTDSNGRGATADSVRCHIPREEREQYDIEIVVAYRIEEAMARVRNGDLDVKDCYVVVDNLTNHAKGSWRSCSDTPEQLTHRVDEFRRLLISSSAAAVVICQIKPMQTVDVRPFNQSLHQYLSSCGTANYGCLTQIRMDYLRADGTHISPKYGTVLDRTYACALRGVPVPSPTPEYDFVPYAFRRRWDDDWPRLVGNVRAGQGLVMR